jgi:tetratricopeptide (TPR) repeat protein
MYRRAADLAANPALAYRYWGMAARDHNRSDECAAALEYDATVMAQEAALAWFFGIPQYLLVAEPCHELALLLFRRSKNANPMSPSTYNSWGILHARRKEYDLAIAKYAAALDIDDRYAFALQNWAIALEAKNDFEKAAKKYDQAIKANPKSANTFVASARLL